MPDSLPLIHLALTACGWADHSGYPAFSENDHPSSHIHAHAPSHSSTTRPPNLISMGHIPFCRSDNKFTLFQLLHLLFSLNLAQENHLGIRPLVPMFRLQRDIFAALPQAQLLHFHLLPLLLSLSFLIHSTSEDRRMKHSILYIWLQGSVLTNVLLQPAYFYPIAFSSFYLILLIRHRAAGFSIFSTFMAPSPLVSSAAFPLLELKKRYTPYFSLHKLPGWCRSSCFVFQGSHVSWKTWTFLNKFSSHGKVVEIVINCAVS